MAWVFLFPFGIGILIGIALIAKLIRWLFANAPIITYAAITGYNWHHLLPLR
jgi:putative membrane protein